MTDVKKMQDLAERIDQEAICSQNPALAAITFKILQEVESDIDGVIAGIHQHLQVYDHAMKKAGESLEALVSQNMTVLLQDEGVLRDMGVWSEEQEKEQHQAERGQRPAVSGKNGSMEGQTLLGEEILRVQEAARDIENKVNDWVQRFGGSSVAGVQASSSAARQDLVRKV